MRGGVRVKHTAERSQHTRIPKGLPRSCSQHTKRSYSKVEICNLHGFNIVCLVIALSTPRFHKAFLVDSFQKASLDCVSGPIF